MDFRKELSRSLRSRQATPNAYEPDFDIDPSQKHNFRLPHKQPASQLLNPFIISHLLHGAQKVVEECHLLSFHHSQDTPLTLPVDSALTATTHLRLSSSKSFLVNYRLAGAAYGSEN